MSSHQEPWQILLKENNKKKHTALGVRALCEMRDRNPQNIKISETNAQLPGM